MENDNKVVATVVCLAAVSVIAIVILVVGKNQKTNVFNCMPMTNTGEINLENENEGGDAGESFEGMSNDDPYFASDKLMPNENPNAPEWVKSFTDGNDKLLQQNFIDTSNFEKFQVTRSVCGRKFMSRDLRRTPTVTRDPTTVNSFSLPVIDPVCAKEWNEIRPPLDCF